MKTDPVALRRTTLHAAQAEAVLRRCVHCGFCNAVCPTYQQTGDERDGPRGRIYLIQQFLEEKSSGHLARYHLDRCLTCLSCERHCPSGVSYHSLLEIGRESLQKRVPRSATDRIKRCWLGQILLSKNWLPRLFATARQFSFFMPKKVKARLMPKFTATLPAVKASGKLQKVVLLEGCIQQAATPQINQSASWFLQALGWEVVRLAGCCGALRHHLDLPEGRGDAKALVDALWREVEQGARTIVFTASGCGAFLKGYTEFFADEPQYLSRAENLTARMQDISEVLMKQQEQLCQLFPQNPRAASHTLAFHTPCTFQHALGLKSSPVKSLLTLAGYEMTATRDDHLCCGSAGTYSILQPDLSQKVRKAKLSALGVDAPAPPCGIATANVGCALHLQVATDIPVAHWIEWLAKAASATQRA